MRRCCGIIVTGLLLAPRRSHVTPAAAPRRPPVTGGVRPQFAHPRPEARLDISKFSPLTSSHGCSHPIVVAAAECLGAGWVTWFPASACHMATDARRADTGKGGPHPVRNHGDELTGELRYGGVRTLGRRSCPIRSALPRMLDTNASRRRGGRDSAARRMHVGRRLGRRG